MRHANPILAADLTVLSRVKEIRHNRSFSERSFVFWERDHLDEPHAAIADSVIVFVAMAFLYDYFVLQTGGVGRDVVDGRLVAQGDGSSSRQGKRRGGACRHHRGLAFQLAGEVLTGSFLQFV